MEKLSLEIDNQLTLMEKYSLTIEEVFVIQLLFLASSDEEHPEYLKRYYTNSFTKTGLRDVLISLQNKGVILKSYKIPEQGKPFNPASVEFNSLFINNYRKCSGELGHEFLETYPAIAYINGTNFSMNNWAKKFKTEEEFYFAYGKAIGWKQKEHERVLELVNWGKESQCNLLNINICDFVISKLWNNIEKVRNGEGVMTFDSTTSI